MAGWFLQVEASEPTDLDIVIFDKNLHRLYRKTLSGPMVIIKPYLKTDG
ncbi:hypothetical protein [Tuberibacillus sp. Marseille-P3662]|nr:hypothetical protein [Tuberibacillus sp. Marseille-P3662]